MNKRGFVITVGMIVFSFIAFLLFIMVSGGVSVSLLSSIPAPVWIVLVIILLFSITGGKKR